MKIYKIKYRTSEGIKETTCTARSVEQYSRVLDVIKIEEVNKPKESKPINAEYRRKYNCLYAKYRRGNITKDEFSRAIEALKETADE